MIRPRFIVVSALVAMVTVLSAPTVSANAPTITMDPAQGQALSIVPPGNNGLVNVAQLVAFESEGKRPANSDDQYKQYEDLPYNANLSESQIANYFDPESFILPANQVASVETPSSSEPVTITWSTHGVPYIDGGTDEAAAFGAGYAQAQVRLFEMDVFRHYGMGDLSSFVGPSCSDESMDQQQLFYAAATTQQLNTEIAALPAEYPQNGVGEKTLQMLNGFVAGVNAYIKAALTNVNLLPSEYLAIGKLPTYFTDADVVAEASLIGGILGSGGGTGQQDAGTLEYLTARYGQSDGTSIFNAFKEQNDPEAPTTITDKSFPYTSDPATLNPALNELPDHALAPLTGIAPATTPGCSLASLTPSKLPSTLQGYISTLPAQAVSEIESAIPSLDRSVSTLVDTMAAGFHFPTVDSNALVVTAAHSTTGHPIAVFGPQVGYWAPEILMQEVLVAPGIAADGASFPGTGLVELGRGLDYAWSATSAGSQNIDTRVLNICNPNGGAPAAQGTDYLLNGVCTPMTEETFTETCTTTPGGIGLPVVITNHMYFAGDAIVQGWTTVDGQPAAVALQRSDYLHDIDSIVGFYGFDSYDSTTGVQSWMKSAAEINFEFNWLYVDANDAAYYQSGLNPLRPDDVNANFPETESNAAAWTGFLSADAHPHEVNPKDGYFVSWNNKPAPLFSASNAEFSYGDDYRSQMLVNNLKFQLYTHSGKVDPAQVVSAMASAATQDFSALVDWPVLDQALPASASPQDHELMNILESWVATGAHRIQAQPGVGQYLHADAVAISDELYNRLVEGLFGPIFGGDGIGTVDSVIYGKQLAFKALPQLGFANPPAALGSAYDDGFEGDIAKLLDQMVGIKVAQPYPAAVLAHVCGPAGIASCPATIESVLTATWNALVTENGGSTNPTTWTNDVASVTANETIPELDEIKYTTVGVVGQPAMPWQNRPTFQQVVSFPETRSGQG